MIYRDTANKTKARLFTFKKRLEIKLKRKLMTSSKRHNLQLNYDVIECALDSVVLADMLADLLPENLNLPTLEAEMVLTWKKKYKNRGEKHETKNK